ncbi:MAG: MFS transporter [Roseiflexaceae bacterium]
MRYPTFGWIFFAFVCGYITSNFLRSANAVISPNLMNDIGLTADQLGLMTSLYYITFAAIQLPMGAALDRYGSRIVIPILLIPTIVGTIIYANAGAFWHVALGRLLIGVGTAGGLMGAVKTFGNWVPSNRLATTTTSLVAIGSVGGLLSTTPMALVNEAYGWRIIFIGSSIFVAFTAILIWGITRDTPEGVTPIRTTGNPFAGYGDIYRTVDFLRLTPIYFSQLGTLLAVQTLWAGPFAYDVARFTPSQTGIALLIMGLGTAAGYAVSGPLADKWGTTHVIISAQIVMLSVLLYFVFLPIAPTPLVISAIYALFGFGASANVVMLPQARRMFSPQMSGRAAVALNIFGFLGGFVVQWLMGLVINAFGRDDQGFYISTGYQSAFAIPLIIGVIAFVIYLPLHLRHLRKDR